jgi:hypothetical protein
MFHDLPTNFSSNTLSEIRIISAISIEMFHENTSGPDSAAVLAVFWLRALGGFAKKLTGRQAVVFFDFHRSK